MKKKSLKNGDDPDERGPKFMIWIVPSKCNLKCSHCYVDKFGDGLPTGRAKKEMILKPEEMVEFLKAIDEGAESLKFKTSLWCLPFARLIVKSQYISAGYCRTWDDEIEIDPKGNLLLCDISNIKFSNVLEKGIFEAWREEKEDPLVKSLTNPKLAEPYFSCKLRKKCQGGCFARAELNGNIYAPDPFCPRIAGLL